jgi:hypothetical protein
MVAYDFDLHGWFGGVVGGGIDIGNGQTYDVHAESRDKRQITWRKQSVENPWVEGTYDTQAVRGNVTENVVVWVYGASPSDFRNNLENLVAYVDTPNWALRWVYPDGMQELWDCTFSDYSVETQREFQYANQGICRINVQRRPRVTITYSDASQFVG